MRITVKFFAILRDRAGVGQTQIDLVERATVQVALTQLARTAPAMGEVLPRVACAVNCEYVKPDHILRDGDELALIPPVSGG